MNSRYEIEEASEFLEPVDKVPLVIDDEDDYQVSTEISQMALVAMPSPILTIMQSGYPKFKPERLLITSQLPQNLFTVPS